MYGLEARSRMLTQARCNLILRELASCGRENERLEVLFGHLQVVAVRIQEHVGRLGGGSFIPIDVRMIRTDVEQIRGRHLVDVLVEVPIAGALLRHLHGGIERGRVAQAISAAVQRYLLRVDVFDIFAAQKDRVGYYLARRL